MSLKKRALLLGELGPFPKENSLFLDKIVLFFKEFFYSMGNLLEIGT